MEAKRSSPPVSTNLATLILLGMGIALLVFFYRPLSWAAHSLPRLAEGSIDAPLEKRLYIKAARIICKGDDISAALPLLERSIRIDPRSEALFWAGQYYLRVNDSERGLEYLYRHKAADPSHVQTYLAIAALHRAHGRIPEAIGILQEGCTYFNDFERYRPVIDDSVPQKYNVKADQSYRYRKDAFMLLRRHLAGISAGNP